MILPKKLIASSVGRKAIMALTGAGLVAFLIVHLSGNLLVFAGPDAINAYSATLHSMPKLLWVARIGLIVIFGTHLVLGITLRLENRRARPVGYANEKTIQATLASRSMIITGLVILAYVVYHLAHFTLGIVDPLAYDQFDNLQRRDVYNMLVLSFQSPVVAGTYIFAMLTLALHLSHGLPSLFQSMGWNSPRFDATLKRVGLVLSIIFFVGYSSIPTAILLGIVR